MAMFTIWGTTVWEEDLFQGNGSIVRGVSCSQSSFCAELYANDFIT